MLKIVLIAFLVGELVLSLVDCVRFEKSANGYYNSIALPYHVFRQVYNANPENWTVVKNDPWNFIYYIWTDPMHPYRYEKVRFSTYWGYRVAAAKYRLSWFRRKSDNKRKKRIKETEEALEFISTVQASLQKQVTRTMGSCVGVFQREQDKARHRYEHLQNLVDLERNITVLPGT